MTDYNFLNLSPYEFEILSRDLLQKYLTCHIESFSSGADKGIDLRCFLHGNVIIQCKRYNDFSSLQSALKEEAEKVKKLNPDRYILTTSVGLTPERKNKIFKLFSPFILTEDDIMGKEDLNNFLAQYPEIEKLHFKLWLSSINILQEIINRNIVNQTQFKLEEIKEKIKIYVQNDSYFEAVDILKENKYVIISGMPGIGKSILAEMLAYRLLASGIDEFIFLSDSVQEGYKMYDNEKSQIFLFDDFLGRNFLVNSLNTNEEAAIIRFISKIQKSNNKYLIFTTREYILNQARIRYDLINNEPFIKCVIDLSKYTKLAKAKILYNHLFFFGVPIEYVNQLSAQNLLFRILEHRNYNPRIVETLTRNRKWKELSPKDFPQYIFNLFENPELIWEHTFENAILQKSRVILYVLLLLDGNAEYDKLYEETEVFTKKTSNKYSDNFDTVSFKNCLRELENTFIEIQSKDNTNSRKITYQNPSIQDFLIGYINKDDVLKLDIIKSATYFNLLLELFADKRGFDQTHRLTLSKELRVSIENEIIIRFDDFKYFSKYTASHKTKEDIIIDKLYTITTHLDLSHNSLLNAFIIRRLNDILYSDKIVVSVYYFMKLLNTYKNSMIIDLNRIMKNIIKEISEYDDILELYELRIISEDDYYLFISENSEEYEEKVSSIVSEMIQNVDNDELKDTLEIVENIESISEIDFMEEKELLEQKIEELESGSYEEFDGWDDGDRSYLKSPLSENKIINDLFSSYQ